MSITKAEESRLATFKPVFDRIECDAGIIFVDTPEETRLIREIYRTYKSDSVQFWSIGQGLHEVEQKKLSVNKFYPHKFPAVSARMGKNGNFDTRVSPLNLFSLIEEDCRDKAKPNEVPDKKHIYVLRDLDKFLKDPVCLRRLKDLVYLCATTCSCIIVTGYGITVPIELEKDAQFVKLKYPTREEIIEGILKNTREQITEHNKVVAPKDRIDNVWDDVEVARACGGLTEDQILNTLQYSMTVHNKIDITSIIEEKRSIINKSDILEYWTCTQGLDEVGGFKAIKEWIAIQKTVMDHIDNAAKFKTTPPKAIMLLGVQGSGKAQPLYTPVLMADKSWKKMEDIEVGDKILTPKGKASTVKQIFNHYDKDNFIITFKDGRSTECCNEHLWKVYNKNWKTQKEAKDGWKIITLNKLIKYSKYTSDTRRFYIPLPSFEFDTQEIDLPFDPYIMGVLLGDGCFRGNGVIFTSNDEEIVKNVEKRLLPGYKITKIECEERTPDYRISLINNDGHTRNFYKVKLEELGYWGKLSWEKNIPEIYLNGSLNQRLELLRGLLDTDGYAGNSISYSTTSPNLMHSMIKLIRSVGGQAFSTTKISKVSKESTREFLSFNINIRYHNPKDLFNLTRKKDKLSDNYQYNDLKLEITEIRQVKSEDMRCLLLDDEEHLYITNDYIVTHNTFCAQALAQHLKVSLLKFEIGKVFAGLVGESEKRMRQALTLADAVGGIIVIDELDKGLSGAGSSDKTDGGTTNRVIGSLLTWLNEDHPGLLLVATANDITSLRNNHPELLRKGRFDEIWFSDVPNAEEREEIYGIHIKKSGRDPKKFDLKKLAEYEYIDNDHQKFTVTGAEIKSSIEDAKRNKFAKGGGKEIEIGGKDDITTEDILECLKKIKPITKIGKEKINAMRKWSEDNATNVSAGIPKAEKKKGTKSKVNLREANEEIEL
jgi:ATP-dependent 26S proteasome regulatory subunit